MTTLEEKREEISRKVHRVCAIVHNSMGCGCPPGGGCEECPLKGATSIGEHNCVTVALNQEVLPYLEHVEYTPWPSSVPCHVIDDQAEAKAWCQWDRAALEEIVSSNLDCFGVLCNGCPAHLYKRFLGHTCLYGVLSRMVFGDE